MVKSALFQTTNAEIFFLSSQSHRQRPRRHRRRSYPSHRGTTTECHCSTTNNPFTLTVNPATYRSKSRRLATKPLARVRWIQGLTVNLLILLHAITMKSTIAWVARPTPLVVLRKPSNCQTLRIRNTVTARSTFRNSNLNMALDSRELRFLSGSFAEFTSHCRFASSSSTIASVLASGAAAAIEYENSFYRVSEGSRRVPPTSQQRQAQPQTQRRNTHTKSSSSAPGISALPTQPRQGYGPSIQLTEEERALFTLLRQVRSETKLDTTLRVAGGWVRDKLLATPEFQTYHKVLDVGSQRLTSKFQKPSAPSMGRQGTKVLVNTDKDAQPVDIDIALDDMLGREFADRLNEYLSMEGQDTIAVGVVFKKNQK
jgi:hypothetical protein